MSKPPAPGPVVVLVNLKGGTGKTTLATTIAEDLKAHLVDLDPQGDAHDWATRSEIVTATKPHSWKESLTVVETARRSGPVVIDCPPGDIPAIRAALAIATVAVIPAKGAMQDLRAVSRMVELVKEVRTKINPSLRVGLVLNEARFSTNLAEQAENVMGKIPGTHYLGHIGLRQAFVDAYISGRAVHSGPARKETKAMLENLYRLIRRNKP
jgi:chromosome partitioning protein